MSSIYDKSSLVLIPSGTKTGKVFSQKPTNGDGDFTFTRASAATRVNAAGNIEKETQNLLTKSNTLSAWSNSNTTETGGQSGYDGSSDAWLVTKSNSNAFIGISASYSGVFTQSVYAKAGSLNWVALQNSGISQTLTWFDLQNGVTGSTQSSVISHSITDVGNGWYRCEVTYNGSSSTFRIFPSVSDNNTSGTSGNIYIQDAQLEQGLVARDYIETTTSAVYGGITDNVPRLDYTDSSCPALLLEPLRTNLVTQSEYFGGYTKTSISVDDNSTISPEGVENAAKLIESSDASASSHYVRGNSFAVVTNTIYTFSVFAKSNGRGIQIRAQNAAGSFAVVLVSYDLTLGVIDGNGDDNADYIDSNIEDYGNGWYRCSLQMKFTDSGNTLGRFAAYTYNESINNHSYVGDGTSGIYIYGAQLEAGSYPTSLIPTYGSSVSRVAENSVKSGISDLIGQTEGTLFFEGKADDYTNAVSIMNTNRTTQFTLVIVKNPDGTILGQVYNNGSSIINITTPSAVSGTFKLALAYKSGDSSFYVNGTQIGTSSVAFTPNASLNELYIGSFDGPYFAYDHPVDCNQALLFKTRLSNQELATLTTI